MKKTWKQELDESYLKMARKALERGVRLEDELRMARKMAWEKGMEEGLKKVLGEEGMQKSKWKQELDESYRKKARKALERGVRLEDELKAVRATYLEKGWEEGMEKAREEGIKHKVALKMLASGKSHKDISHYTGLSLDEIKSLT